MVWNIQKDLKSGNDLEKVVIKYLNDNIYFEDNLIKYENEMEQVDFRNKEIIGELKSRDCSKNRYFETMFGYNKIEHLKSLKNDYRIWKFYFLFTDGLYVWSYNEEQYDVRKFFHVEKQQLLDYVYVHRKDLECLTRRINSKMTYQEQIEYINRTSQENVQSS